MKLSAFKFELPEDRIAKYPTENRDESRLMVIHREKGEIEHKVFKDIVNFFDEGDVMVNNNTKVFLLGFMARKKKQELRLRYSY